jgi:hypothetical protein
MGAVDGGALPCDLEPIPAGSSGSVIAAFNSKEILRRVGVNGWLCRGNLRETDRNDIRPASATR